MILFPPCKINLGLHVINKREDGYHNLETVMYQLPLFDVLELNKADNFTFTSSGIAIPGKEENNICIKAFQLLRKEYDIPPVSIHLHKCIPMGAGLGGGSADGTYTIKGISDLFNLELTVQKMQELAATLGSDCAVFVKDTVQLARKTGSLLEDFDLSLQGYYLKLINTGIHVSTQEAFGNLQYTTPLYPVKEVLQKDIRYWKKELFNDFETTVFETHPSLRFLKEQLYTEGALYASMTGSGSTLYGIFREEPLLTMQEKSVFEKIIKL